MDAIDNFVADTPYGKYLWKKQFLSLVIFFALDQIPRIKI